MELFYIAYATLFLFLSILLLFIIIGQIATDEPILEILAAELADCFFFVVFIHAIVNLIKII